MHELAIAESVVETVTQRLPDANVTRVHLEIGALSGAEPGGADVMTELARSLVPAVEMKATRGRHAAQLSAS